LPAVVAVANLLPVAVVLVVTERVQEPRVAVRLLNQQLQWL
jgi:hypothetical protein